MIDLDFPTRPRSSLSSDGMRHNNYVASVGFAEPSCKSPPAGVDAPACRVAGDRTR